MTSPPMNPFLSNVKPIQTTLDDLIANAFPSNIITLSVTRFELYDLGLNVVPRMPASQDPNYTIGIAPVVSSPNPETNEMHGPNGFTGPTVSQYLVAYFAFVKDADRERGLAAHSALAEIVEYTLASDLPFRQSLGQLEATVMGQTKRMQRHWIRQTRYLANDIGGDHLFMSSTEAIFEVEKVL